MLSSPMLWSQIINLASKQIVHIPKYWEKYNVIRRLYPSIDIYLSTMSTDSQVQPDKLASQENDHVYVQHNREKNLMTISFKIDSHGKSKQFNLFRKAEEPLSASLERIRLNMLKASKKSKGPKNEKDTIMIDIIRDGSPLNPESATNHDAWIDGSKLKINDNILLIRSDYPQVESLTIGAHPMQNFIIMPMLTLRNCDISDCKFSWYRKISIRERDQLLESGCNSTNLESEDSTYWLKLSETFFYCPTCEDVGHTIKVVCWPSDGYRVGPTYTCIAPGGVEMSLPRYPFEDRQKFTKDYLNSSNQFRVLSYNILADLYADSDYSREILFKHCPTHALEIEYRRQILLKEISGYNADIICLQEVDKKEFIRTYEPFFRLKSRYHGVFTTKGGDVAEGVATFYRDQKFKLIESHTTLLSGLIEPGKAEPCFLMESHPILKDCDNPEARRLLSRFDSIRSTIFANEKLKSRFLNRHTVLHTSLLKSKQIPNSYLLVANTHLYFAPDADHIRLLQGAVCVNYLEYLKEHYARVLTDDGDKDRKLAILLCGDMNSTPDCGLYKLVTTGFVENDVKDWTSNVEEAVSDLSIRTELRLTSAYQNIEYTNYTPGFNGCLDYIYYEHNQLRCRETIPMPDHGDVIVSGGIPSDVFPSDHLPLIADFDISID